jgi:mono/diheme cytochrome c family protein
MQVVRVHLTLVAFAASLVASGTAQAASAENGKTAYVAHGCWQCHGYEGQGSITTSAGRVIAGSQLPADAFAAYVRQPTGAMPPYSAAILSDADLADIYAYLEARPKPKASGDIPLLNTQ